MRFVLRLVSGTMESIPLRTDQIWGVFACVDADDTASLRETLEQAGIRFAIDPDHAQRLIEEGKHLFVFADPSAPRLAGTLGNYDIPAHVIDGVALTEKSYRPPLEQLLRRGRPEAQGAGIASMKLGFGREHVPELIRMAIDEELSHGPPDSPVVWAPVHAWWALAQLRAEESVVPLLGLLRRVDEDNDDWVAEDLPCVLAEIGAAAIGPVSDYLGNPAHGDWARVAAAMTLGRIAQAHAESRASCLARLVAQLEHYAEQTDP